MKIGGACVWLNSDYESVKDMNLRTTTVKFFSSLSDKDKRKAIKYLVHHNVAALANVVEALSSMPPELRMWRIGSDFLPLATHHEAAEFYDNELLDEVSKYMLKIGQRARAKNVRLSFHPGQFVVIGSANRNIRERSARELEYHANLAFMMGYTGWHVDGFAINVHVGGKQADPSVVRREIKKMSKTLRNNLTFENDEFCWSAKEILHHFSDLVPLVLDVHHYWITRGSRVDPNCKKMQEVVDSWRGVRPKIHLAMSEVDLVPKKYHKQHIPLKPLLDSGLTKGKLRTHSINPWHKPTLDYAKKFLDRFDIIWEGKDKNLGQLAIAKHMGIV